MDNLNDKEKQSKLQAIERGLLDYMYILHGFDNPQGYVEHAKEMAEKILSDLEYVEREFEAKGFEAKLANAD